MLAIPVSVGAAQAYVQLFSAHESITVTSPLALVQNPSIVTNYKLGLSGASYVSCTVSVSSWACPSESLYLNGNISIAFAIQNVGNYVITPIITFSGNQTGYNATFYSTYTTGCPQCNNQGYSIVNSLQALAPNQEENIWVYVIANTAGALSLTMNVGH